jgi:hypothetical protein
VTYLLRSYPIQVKRHWKYEDTQSSGHDLDLSFLGVMYTPGVPSQAILFSVMETLPASNANMHPLCPKLKTDPPCLLVFWDVFQHGHCWRLSDWDSSFFTHIRAISDPFGLNRLYTLAYIRSPRNIVWFLSSKY